VVAFVWDPVQADDRQHHMMADARLVLGGQQVPGDRGEERPHLVGVHALGAGDVDDGLDAVHGGGQPCSGGQIHAGGAGEHDRVVPRASHRLDGRTSDQAGPTGDRDLHHWTSSGSCRRWAS
jgi:hypothetical protein